MLGRVAKVAAVDISAGMLNELAQKDELKEMVTPYCQNISFVTAYTIEKDSEHLYPIFLLKAFKKA